jgi:hypothetical protein
VPAAHCDECAKYEATVMEAAGGPVPATVKPCQDYAISDAFRDWLVDQMRREVLAQVSTSGLDRMAIVKAGKGTAGARDGGSAKEKPKEERGREGVEQGP